MPKKPHTPPDDSVPVVVDDSEPTLIHHNLRRDDSAGTAVAKFVASVPPPPIEPRAALAPPPAPLPREVEPIPARAEQPARTEPMPARAEQPVRTEPMPVRAERTPMPGEPLAAITDRAPPLATEPARRPPEVTSFRSRHLIVVGGGRGGVGKSLVAEGLAVYFAQLGKNVVLIDADPNGSNLHSRLGVQPLALDAFSDDTLDFEEVLEDTEVPGLRLLAYPHEALRPPGTLRGTRKARWLSRLRKLEADFLVVDAGPGNSQFTMDLLLAADVAVLVTTPEPPAVEAVYRFLRASFLAKLRRAVHRDRLRSVLLERALSDFGRLPPPLPFVRALYAQDPGLADIAWKLCQKTSFQLVVNQTRLRTDIELGSFMSELCARRYGVPLQELGHIEHDDSVHFAVRRRRSLLVDNPAAKASRNVERIARRVLGKLLTPEVDASLAKVPADPPSYYAMLGLSRGASDEDARRNFKRRREMLHEESIATFSLYEEGALMIERSRLEEAYDTLMDPIRRRAYDLSLFGELEQAPQPVIGPSLRDRAVVESELAREIGPDAEFSGALLRKIREAYGASLDDLASHSKIAKNHLVAIEEERWVELPAAVYVRGYVTEFAKFFGLDAPHVQRTYMRRYQAARP